MTKTYYGTKKIEAWPENRKAPIDGDVIDENHYRLEAGYAVKYEDGYTSWSPKDVFEKAYQPVTAMNFGHALQAMRDGYNVARPGWEYSETSEYMFIDDEGVVMLHHGPGYGFGAGEVPADDVDCEDILANDWQIVE